MIFHILAALALLTPLAAAQADARGGVVLRPDAPAMTPEHAKTLTPADLGDRLLAPGHPVVVGDHVGLEGMEPPPPPGQPVATRITLFLQAMRSDEAGFCQRMIATVLLAPVDQRSDGSLPASRADTLATEVRYRWHGGRPTDAECAAPADAWFFAPRAGEARLAFDTVRRLAAARAIALRGRAPTFPVTIDDRDGVWAEGYRRAHPAEPAVGKLHRITDPREALASLPLDAVTFAGPASAAAYDINEPSSVADASGRDVDERTVFLARDWVVGLRLSDGRISRLRIRREIAAPF